MGRYEDAPLILFDGAGRGGVSVSHAMGEGVLAPPSHHVCFGYRSS